MGLERRAAKRDANEREIIEALERVGCVVFQLDKPADILARRRGHWYLMEVKGPHGKLTGQQERDHARLPPGTIPIVRNPTEALLAVGLARV